MVQDSPYHFAQALSEICCYLSKPQESLGHSLSLFHVLCGSCNLQRIYVTSKGNHSLSFGENPSCLSYCSVQSLCFSDENAVWKTSDKYTDAENKWADPKGKRGETNGRQIDIYIRLCSSDGKEFACNAGDPGSIPGSGRSPGEGNGNLLQYSCLENPMDRGAWWAVVHGVAKSQIRLSD